MIHTAFVVFVIIYFLIGLGVCKLFSRSDMSVGDFVLRSTIVIVWPIVAVCITFFCNWD